MGKFTKETYAIVPSSVLENDVMSLGAKGLYSLLKSKPEDWIFDIKNINSQTNENIFDLEILLSELSEKGYLVRLSKEKEKKQSDYIHFNDYDYILL